jgi:hypothetical protein
MKLQIDAKKNEQGEYVFQGQVLQAGLSIVPKKLRSENGKVYAYQIKGIVTEEDGKIFIDVDKVELSTEETVKLIKEMKKA